MRIAGIIAEYDPFHKGHAAHIAATKAGDGGKATHVVAVISGNFTQRGEPALLSKFTRAEMALAAGADLVLELPLPWAMAPAENFAAGGVAILKALGCVNLISFGSECGDMNILKTLATLSETPAYQSALRSFLASGLPYAAASQAAATSIVGETAAAALSSPNNTLGLEYLRAVSRQEVNFEAFTLLRQGALHNENAPNQGFASASLLRSLVLEGKIDQAAEFMPNETAVLLKNAIAAGDAPADKTILQNTVPALLRRMTPEQFTALPWLSEGLENRLYSVSRTATNYNDILEQLKTRRYPMARLRRVIWSAVLGMTGEDTTGLPPYIRVLGMNARGREILSVAKPTLPILTRTAQLDELNDRCRRVFEIECTATDLHALTRSTPAPCGTDYTYKLRVNA